jgi:hypothetical protein
MTKTGNEALYLLLKTNANSSFRKKNKKKNNGKTRAESIKKLSRYSCIILEVNETFFEISISKKLPITLINKPNKGISNEPLKNIAKSVAVRIYNKKTLSIHFEMTPKISFRPRNVQ